MKSWKEAREKWGENWKEIRKQLKAEFAMQNSERIVSLNTLQKPSEAIQEVINESKNKRNTVFKIDRKDNDPIFVFNGRTLAFYKNKIRKIGGKEIPTKILTNIWTDISYLGIGPEGNVTF